MKEFELNIEDVGLEYEIQKNAFLKDRRWINNNCPSCGRHYFSKNERDNCGGSGCSPESNFLNDERKNKPVTPIQVNENFKRFFQEKGYLLVPPKSILNDNGTTLFTSAGVQILDDIVLRNNSVTDTRILVSQPSLRTQYLDNIKEGNSLSFVNICTEQVNASPTEHVETLDKWLEFLSKQGLYMGDITLIDKSKIQKWGDLTLKSKILSINYKGLEIGDGNYNFGFSPNILGLSSISDFGFGLERLTWLQRKGSYFDCIGPLNTSLRENGFNQELIKTMSLLAASGLNPSNKDKGYRYRLFAKEIATINFPKYISLTELVNYYYVYWNSLTNLSVNADLVVKSVQREYDRNYNQILNSKLSSKLNIDCPTEEFLQLLATKGVERQVIANLLKSN